MRLASVDDQEFIGVFFRKCKAFNKDWIYLSKQELLNIYLTDHRPVVFCTCLCPQPVSHSVNAMRVLGKLMRVASAEESLAGASYTWAWYLTSLKDYLETGIGRPGQAPT